MLTSPTGSLIEIAVKSAIEVFRKEADASSTDELQELARRQEIESRFLQDKARVEQELAIARRIDLAEEVEIEEYYDSSGEGALGFKGNSEGVTIGASGGGRRVTKRVYRFKGWREVPQAPLGFEGLDAHSPGEPEFGHIVPAGE